MTSTAMEPAVRKTLQRSDIASVETRFRKEVVRASQTLEELIRHRELLGPQVTHEITATVSDVGRRLERKELAVVVVGEKKAGKSTLLNAILGARVLGTAVRECTGTVTFIRRGQRPNYRARCVDGSVRVFKDLEANERASLAAEITQTERRTGRPGVLKYHTREQVDSKQRLAQASAEWSEAGRRRTLAEQNAGSCAVRLAESKSKYDRALSERERAWNTVLELRQRLQMAQAQLSGLEGTFQNLEAQTKSMAAQRQLPPPTVTEYRQTDAWQALKTAELRVGTASAAVPFFMRPLPWWAAWMIVVRLLLGWLFRDQMRALAEALQEQKLSQAVYAACETAGRLVKGRSDYSAISAGLPVAQQAFEQSEARVKSAQTEGRQANEVMARAAAAVESFRSEEDLAHLKYLFARSAALEDEAFARYRSEVNDLTDMDKQGQTVLELTIEFPAKHLPDGITIIDTPGVNTKNDTNRDRAWEVLKRNADGCILVSDLQQVVSASTREFLREVRDIIPHILLVMSKVDRALANAEDVGDVDPWEQVEEARRTGVRRFAKEVGRAPDEVFSIAVAAEPALRGDESPEGLGRRFPGEVAKVFELLQSEKMTVLSARAATGLRYCVQQIGEAQSKAEKEYTARIDRLEQQRLPDPKEFQARQLARLEDALRAHGDQIAQAAQRQMADGVDAIQAQWENAIRACSSKDEVNATVKMLGERGQTAIAQVMSDVQQSVALWSSESIRELETPLFEELRSRYRIVQEMTGTGMAVRLGEVGGAAAAAHAANLQTGVAGAVESFENQQLAFGAGGAIAGAVIGTMVFPGLGTAIGAALGALAALFKTLDDLKRDCIGQVRKSLRDAKSNLSSQMASVGPDVKRVMREVLSNGLADAVTRFQSWITQIMQAERKQIEQERQKLRHLVQMRDKLVQHDQSLAALQREAATVSRGLCA